MKLIFKKQFKYSDNGNEVIAVDIGEREIPNRFVPGCIANGFAEKAAKPTKNKAKQAPKNKSK